MIHVQFHTPIVPHRDRLEKINVQLSHTKLCGMVRERERERERERWKKIYVHLSYTQLCQSDWKRYAKKTLSCTTAFDIQRERERETHAFRRNHDFKFHCSIL